MNDIDLIRTWTHRARRAAKDAHVILSAHEESRSRVVVLAGLLKRLSGLPVDIQDYFREATRCLEFDLLRAAVVLSWAGFFHVLVEKMYIKHEAALRAAHAKWTFADLTELKENYPEAQILDACKTVGFIKKAEHKVFHGQLATRNQCAHPTLYRPSLNGALGFVDDMLRQTMKYI